MKPPYQFFSPTTTGYDNASSRYQPSSSSFTSLPPMSTSLSQPGNIADSGTPDVSEMSSSHNFDENFGHYQRSNNVDLSPTSEKSLPGRNGSNSPPGGADGKTNFLKLARLNLTPVKYRIKKLTSLGMYFTFRISFTSLFIFTFLIMSF